MLQEEPTTRLLWNSVMQHSVWRSLNPVELCQCPMWTCISGLASYEAARRALEINCHRLVAAAECDNRAELLLIDLVFWCEKFMRLIYSDVASFLPFSVSALIRNAVAVAASVHLFCPFETGQLIYVFFSCIPCKALTDSRVSQNLIHLHVDLLEGVCFRAPSLTNFIHSLQGDPSWLAESRLSWQEKEKWCSSYSEPRFPTSRGKILTTPLLCHGMSEGWLSAVAVAHAPWTDSLVLLPEHDHPLCGCLVHSDVSILPATVKTQPPCEEQTSVCFLLLQCMPGICQEDFNALFR